MAVSRVSATSYIIKTFENYSATENKAQEGQLNDVGQKRVECFSKLVQDNTINQPDVIFYKDDGTDKNGNVKVNSRRYTAEAIAQKLGVQSVEAMKGDDGQVSTAKGLAEQFSNSLFVWSDKDKAPKLAAGLGATANVPTEFKKSHYGTIWAIDGDQLNVLQMNCEDKGFAGVKDVVSGSQTIRLAVMSVFVSIMATLYFLF